MVRIATNILTGGSISASEKIRTGVKKMRRIIAIGYLWDRQPMSIIPDLLTQG